MHIFEGIARLTLFSIFFALPFLSIRFNVHIFYDITHTFAKRNNSHAQWTSLSISVANLSWSRGTVNKKYIQEMIRISQKRCIKSSAYNARRMDDRIHDIEKIEYRSAKFRQWIIEKNTGSWLRLNGTDFLFCWSRYKINSASVHIRNMSYVNAGCALPDRLEIEWRNKSTLLCGLSFYEILAVRLISLVWYYSFRTYTFDTFYKQCPIWYK